MLLTLVFQHKGIYNILHDFFLNIRFYLNLILKLEMLKKKNAWINTYFNLLKAIFISQKKKSILFRFLFLWLNFFFSITIFYSLIRLSLLSIFWSTYMIFNFQLKGDIILLKFFKKYESNNKYCKKIRISYTDDELIMYS